MAALIIIAVKMATRDRRARPGSFVEFRSGQPVHGWQRSHSASGLLQASEHDGYKNLACAVTPGDASLALWLETGQGELVSQRETITLTADPAGAPNVAVVLGMSRPGLLFPLEGLFLGLLSLTVWLAWKLAGSRHPT